MLKERRIIYVDAGNKDSEVFKISLYDVESNATHIMELVEVDDNNEAEKYAVFYAIFYINRNNIDNCMILCDNNSAVVDNTIKTLAKKLKISISWIPREINKIADKTCKLDSTLKDSDFNTLKLFIDLSIKAFVKDDVGQENKQNEIDKLKEQIMKHKEQIEKHKEKVKNQATQINALKKKSVK